MSKPYTWNEGKNKLLKLERGVSFDDTVRAIESGGLLVTEEHHSKKYSHQRIYVVNIGDYAYLVPFVEDKEKFFLKTVYPSRKATRRYLKKG